jgi:aspartate aminotransferase
MSFSSSALDSIRPEIAALSLENISSFVMPYLGDPDIIPLWFGEGDLPAPDFVGAAMTRAVADGHVFYTHQNGVAPLREAIATYLTGLHARPTDAAQITVTVSGMNAVMLALHAVAAPGDNIVIIDPLWPNHAGMARLIGVEARHVRMDPTPAGWTLNMDMIRAAVTARTRAIVFASPANPTGAVISLTDLRALLDLGRERGLWIIGDEVYNRLVYDGRPAPSLHDLIEPEDRALVVQSFSKAWAMTGWRLGWLAHPPSLGPHLAMMTQFTTSGVPTFVQYAGVAALQQGEPFVGRMRDYCATGSAIVHDTLDSLNSVRTGPRPVAGMYAYFEIEGLADSKAAALEILRKAKVGLAPGAFFGPGSETYLRLCVARDPKILRRAMDRLAEGLG